MEPIKTPLSGWKAAAAIGGIAALVFLFTRGPGQTHQSLGEGAPDFRLPDLSGKMVALSDFKGKVVLVDFWATWCGPCQEEIPDLIALQAKFKDKGFTVLGVDMDVGSAKVGPFVADNKLTYPVLLAGGDAPKGYDVPGLPAAVLVDRKGRMVRSYLGERDLDDFTRDVEAVIDN
jgi:thiol-disulfide isomerase/thioredoxin